MKNNSDIPKSKQTGPGQTMQTQSDHGLHCLQSPLHIRIWYNHFNQSGRNLKIKEI